MGAWGVAEVPEVSWEQRKGGKEVRQGYNGVQKRYKRGTKGVRKGYKKERKGGRKGTLSSRRVYERRTKGLRKGPFTYEGVPFRRPFVAVFVQPHPLSYTICTLFVPLSYMHSY